MSFTTKMTEQFVHNLYQKNAGNAKTAQNNKAVGKNAPSGQKFEEEAAVYEGSVNQSGKGTYTKPVAVGQNKEKKDDLQAKLEKTYEALSDEAKDYLAQLKEKFGDIDFFVADCRSDEEMSRYFAMGTKKYSCVISSSLLEKMATDEEARAKYEGIIDGADEQIEEMKEDAAKELGEEAAEQIEYVGFTIDDNGVVNYFAKLKDSNDAYYEKLKEKRAEEKKEAKAEEKHKEEKLKHQEWLDKKKENGVPEKDEFWIKADTKEGLLEAIREALGIVKEETPEISVGE